MSKKCGCPFKLSLYKGQRGDEYKLNRLNLNHTCNYEMQVEDSAIGVDLVSKAEVDQVGELIADAITAGNVIIMILQYKYSVITAI